MILSKSDESSYPRLVPDLRVKAFNILPLRMTLPVDVSVDGLYQMRKFPSINSRRKLIVEVELKVSFY